MMSIPLDAIEQVLTRGWTNKNGFDISRVIQPGEVLTIVLSDAPFTVPDTIGSANVLGSKQHEFTGLALVKVRVTERD